MTAEPTLAAGRVSAAAGALAWAVLIIGWGLVPVGQLLTYIIAIALALTAVVTGHRSSGAETKKLRRWGLALGYPILITALAIGVLFAMVFHGIPAFVAVITRGGGS